MARSYSVAEAKSHLSRVLHEVEASGSVELTRRGRPVAVLVSVGEYRRLRMPRRDFAEVVRDLRQRFDVVELDIDPDEVFADVRDPSPGRDFSW